MRLQSEPGFPRKPHPVAVESQAFRKFLTALFHGPMFRPIDTVFLVRLGAGVVLVAAGLRLCFWQGTALPVIGFALVSLGALLVVETLRFDDSRD